jgi:hypothetical protein
MPPIGKIMLTDTEKLLIKVSAKIGGINGMAGWASAELAVMIKQTSKALQDMTVKELCALIDEHGMRHTPSNPEKTTD